MNKFKLTLLEERIVLDAAAVAAALQPPSTFAHTFYVDAAVAVDGDGSQANPFNNLQEALTKANDLAGVDQIRVAGNTYKPTNNPLANDSTYTIHSDVYIYGGYNSGFTVRDINLYPTILSGDILGNDINTGGTSRLTDVNYINSKQDNVWHILTLDGTSTVVMDGLTIRNGYADGGTPSDFSNSRGAGIISLLGSNLALNNMKLENNFATFTGGVLMGNGSAIYMEGGALNVDKSVFQSNAVANVGGAINTFFTEVNIINSTFQDNHTLYPLGVDPLIANPEGGAASFLGGSIFISNTQFLNNTATGAGGALAWFSFDGQSLYIGGNSLFQGNSSGFTGGALLSVSVDGGNMSNVTIESTIFKDNSNLNQGGAILVDSQNLLIKNSTFISNTAPMGGALSIQNSSALFGAPSTTNIIDNSNFIRNKAVGELSETYLEYTSLFGVLFPPDLATAGGGAIAVSDGALVNVINHSTFVNNEAPNGGAISVIGYAVALDFGGGPFLLPSFASATITDSTFTNNKATEGDGGAVLSESWLFPDHELLVPTSTTIQKSQFNNNTAQGHGGAVAGVNTHLEVKTSNFNANSGNLNGGALYLLDSDAIILNNRFGINSADEIGDKIYSDGSTVNGLTSPTDILANLKSNNQFVHLDSDDIVIV